jgi:AraC-like DNA-binding protein
MHSHKPFSKVIAACQINDLDFREISYVGDYAMPLHTHEEVHLALGLKGTTRVAWRKQTIVTPTFTLTFIPAGEPHAVHFHDGVQVFVIKLTSSWLHRIRQVSPFEVRPTTFQNDLPAWGAMHLYREFQNQDNLTPLMLEALTLELLVGMSRDTFCAEKKVPLWLQQAKDFLHTHFRENLSLDAVAAAVNIHPAHLTRAFRQHFHCTMGSYLRKRRIECARPLLSASVLSLTQIALEIGFADQSHFSRTFKSLTGMTPAEYRKVSGGAGQRQEMLP